MMKALVIFLAYWLGSSILLTILSLWMWDAVFLHQTIGLGFLGATAWVLIVALRGGFRPKPAYSLSE